MGGMINLTVKGKSMYIPRMGYIRTMAALLTKYGEEGFVWSRASRPTTTNIRSALMFEGHTDFRIRTRAAPEGGWRVWMESTAPEPALERPIYRGRDGLDLSAFSMTFKGEWG